MNLRIVYIKSSSMKVGINVVSLFFLILLVPLDILMYSNLWVLLLKDLVLLIRFVINCGSLGFVGISYTSLLIMILSNWLWDGLLEENWGRLISLGTLIGGEFFVWKKEKENERWSWGSFFISDKHKLILQKNHIFCASSLTFFLLFSVQTSYGQKMRSQISWILLVLDSFWQVRTLSWTHLKLETIWENMELEIWRKVGIFIWIGTLLMVNSYFMVVKLWMKSWLGWKNRSRLEGGCEVNSKTDGLRLPLASKIIAFFIDCTFVISIIESLIASNHKLFS